MKISIIGAGNVGGLAALRIAQENLGEVLLIDVVPGLAQGKAFDLDDCRQILATDFQVKGTDDIGELRDSRVIVITAGLARKPGMTREDLLAKNAAIMQGICAQIALLAQDAVVIVVTNPLDVMTYYAFKALGLPKQRVFGMGPTLDGSRFANCISRALDIPATQIQPMVIGSHGEAMLPLARFTLVRSKPLTEVIPDAAAVEGLVKKTVERGKEIVSLLGSGSAFTAPSAAIAQLVRSVVLDQKLTLPVSACLTGEYGLTDICIGVPAIIGAQGIERIITLDLNTQEQRAFQESAQTIKSLALLLP